jgi:putative acetyltransferase
MASTNDPVPVTIRRMSDDDWSAAREVISAAFGGERVADLAAALRERPDRGVSIVAEANGAVVGHVHLSTSWVDAPQQLVEVLVLSPLSVAPANQTEGIGRALVGAAVAEAERLESPLLFLEGDPAYYGRLGWVRASSRGFTAPSARIPEAAFQVFVLPAWEAWMTGALVYNDTFWSHDCVGLR